MSIIFTFPSALNNNDGIKAVPPYCFKVTASFFEENVQHTTTAAAAAKMRDRNMNGGAIYGSLVCIMLAVVTGAWCLVLVAAAVE